MKPLEPTSGISRALKALAFLALGASAQPSDWEKVDLGGRSLFQDKAWIGRDLFLGPPPNPLASDGAGRLYLANGRTLLIGTERGTRWTAATRTLSQDEAEIGTNAPLAAGNQEFVLWGRAKSADAGATWDTLENLPGIGVLAVMADGALVHGTYLDHIYRASAPHRRWDPVHRGQTFGQIERIQAAGRLVVAQPTIGDLLYSLDTGKTWNEFTVGHDIWFPRTRVRAIGLDAREGTPLWVALYGGTAREGNLLVRASLFHPHVDTLEADLPDSVITDVLAHGERIWLGTRGQGAWLSTDNGQTFRPRNRGLAGRGLHVVAFERTSDGDVYALTPGGLHRAAEAGTSLGRTRPSLRLAGNRSAALGLAGLPGAWQPHPSAGARYRVLADGRVSILPLPSATSTLPGDR